MSTSMRTLTTSELKAGAVNGYAHGTAHCPAGHIIGIELHAFEMLVDLAPVEGKPHDVGLRQHCTIYIRYLGASCIMSAVGWSAIY